MQSSVRVLFTTLRAVGGCGTWSGNNTGSILNMISVP